MLSIASSSPSSSTSLTKHPTTVSVGPYSLITLVPFASSLHFLNILRLNSSPPTTNTLAPQLNLDHCQIPRRQLHQALVVSTPPTLNHRFCSFCLPPDHHLTASAQDRLHARHRQVESQRRVQRRPSSLPCLVRLPAP